MARTLYYQNVILKSNPTVKYYEYMYRITTLITVRTTIYTINIMQSCIIEFWHHSYQNGFTRAVPCEAHDSTDVRAWLTMYRFYGSWILSSRLSYHSYGAHTLEAIRSQTNNMAGELSHWPIFSLLGKEFRQSLRYACVFGASGNEAIAVLKNDEVHALGSNSNCCLGLGTSSSSLHPRRVDPLCGKGKF